MLAVPRDHPLALRPHLQLRDIGRYPFIAYEPVPGGALNELQERAFVAAQFMPSVVQRSRQTQTILSLVSAGAGIALVPETAQHACFGNVQLRAIEIEGNPLLDMQAIWRGDNPNPVLPPLLGLIQKLFQTPAAPGVDA
jgi:DNA-binding transcriptional LysR family regulator